MNKKPPQNEQKANSPKAETTAGETPYRPEARPLTAKQREFARLVGTEPSMTKAEAYRQAYDAKGSNDKTVSVEVARTLAKPQVKIELAKYNDTARLALLEVIEESRKRMKQASDRDGSAWAKVLQATGDSVLDRTEGKATQRVQVQSTGVVLMLDLSGSTTPTEVTENK